MRPSQITSIEEGKKDDFKDIFYLKYFIRDYAKYLGLDSEKIIDEFNEYLFDETSKIPIDIIEQAKKEKKEDTEELSSPYTKKEKNKIKIPKIIIGLFILIILIIVGYIIASNYKGNDFSDNNITYSIRRISYISSWWQSISRLKIYNSGHSIYNSITY